MTRVSTIAFAAALATAGAITTVPATAQKRGEQQAAGFKFSSGEIVQAISAAKTALDAGDTATAEPLVVQVESKVQNDDDKFAAATLRLALESRKNQAARAAGQPVDQTRLVTPYTVLLDHPKTPAESRATYALDLGVIFFNSKQYQQAVTYFERAKQLGSTDPNLDANLVRAKLLGGDKAGGMTALTTMIEQQSANGGKAGEDLYRFAISQTVAARDNAGTLNWMKRYLTAYPTAKNWRDMIKIYGLQQGSLITVTRPQSLDLYRLMRATKSLGGQFDYEDYAQRAVSSGLPWEARAVITEGKASGKIPSSSSVANEILTRSTNSINVGTSLAALETKAKASADGKLAAQTGDAQLGSGNYAKAAELYRLALQKGGANAAEVNTRLGIALAMSGDRAGAKTALQAVTGAPAADIAALWIAFVEAPVVAG
jgi:Flp pilus assembly protein TadD